MDHSTRSRAHDRAPPAQPRPSGKGFVHDVCKPVHGPLERLAGKIRLSSRRSSLSFDYHSVAGDYQYRALHSGHPMQRFWHRGKLFMIDELIRPRLRAGSRILEIGCGAGNLLLESTVAGSYPVALDLSMQALTFVRSR